MTQSTIMSAATTIGTTSSDITVAAGGAVRVGLFTASGTALPQGVSFPIFAATPGPGQDLPIATLSYSNPTHIFAGPGTFRVVRNGVLNASQVAVAVGVFLDSASGGALATTPGPGGVGGVGNASAAVTSVNSAATSTALLAANTSRRGVLITNTDANTLRLKYGTTASATSFSAPIPANGYWEMPQPIYAGAIEGIWDADGSGAAIITELT